MENEPFTVESGGDWSKREVSRRRLLAMAMGGAVATAAALAGGTKTVRAADGDSLIIGSLNAGSSPTGLSGSELIINVDSAEAALHAENTRTILNPQGFPGGVLGASSVPGGYGVRGIARTTELFPNAEVRGVLGETDSAGGIGVQGLASATSGPTKGVWARSESTEGVGVLGDSPASSGATRGAWGISLSTDGIGVQGDANASSGTTKGVFGRAFSPDGIGVQGASYVGGIGVQGNGQIGVQGDGSPGVQGTGNNVGVQGIGGTRGVEGIADTAFGIGVLAKAASGGIGLLVEGRSVFSTILSGAIPNGANDKTIANPAVKPNSEVIVMLTGDPGKLLPASTGPFGRIKNAISWVNVAAGSFTVSLMATNSTGRDVPFKAFIAEQPT